MREENLSGGAAHLLVTFIRRGRGGIAFSGIIVLVFFFVFLFFLGGGGGGVGAVSAK